MRFFRKVTENHVVIMGRKTFESLGRPLPNRINIILSRSNEADGKDLFWATNREMALFLADTHSILKEKSEIIVIGGAQIYKIFSDLFTKIYLTEVFHQIENGDAHFTERFDKRYWAVTESQSWPASDHDQYPFEINVLERRNKYVRHREISDFYVGNQKDKVSSFLPVLADKLSKPTPEENRQAILPLKVA
ncbi:hypothetical protein GCM10007884_18850 [Methylobacterium brachythecii]|nr:hypothetical protein GCM10007884_18850 [Methylobacterium brachythecii]